MKTKILFALLFIVSLSAFAADPPFLSGATRHSLLDDPAVFPIGVWMQSPKRADSYRAAGINFYVGLWNGPTEEQLKELMKHEMPVICDLNGVALKHLEDPMILAWMHGDEPDNSQGKVIGEGWDWPVPPGVIVSDYHRIKGIDPSRPVLLNLGKGVADEKYVGRGPRTGHLEDYPAYIQGCDIVSYDIYPVTDSDEHVHENLWFVAQGVERLVQWAKGKKPVWSVIEASQINGDRVATPVEIRAMVWMSIIRGARGIIYFSHEWKPKFSESALLDNPVTLKGVTQINAELQRFAKVIHAPLASDLLTVQSTKSEVPVAASAHRFEGNLFLFLCNLRDEETTVEVTIAEGFKAGKGTELSEPAGDPVAGNQFSVALPGNGVRIYRIEP